MILYTKHELHVTVSYSLITCMQSICKRVSTAGDGNKDKDFGSANVVTIDTERCKHFAYSGRHLRSSCLICRRGHVATSSSPVDMNVFTLRIFLRREFWLDLEGVRAKVISLSLQ